MALEESINLNELITQGLSKLAKREYKASYINHHRLIYYALQQYCEESSIDYYSEVVGEQFLEEVKEKKPSLRHHTMNEYRMGCSSLKLCLVKNGVASAWKKVYSVCKFLL